MAEEAVQPLREAHGREADGDTYVPLCVVYLE